MERYGTRLKRQSVPSLSKLMMGAGAPIAFRHMQRMIFHIEKKTNWIGGLIFDGARFREQVTELIS
jgi:hypothetical protein